MEITHIRLLPPEADEALKKFVFGGHYGPLRPPRGVAPAQVAAFVKARVLSEGDADDFAKTLELVRFYETKEVVEPMLRLLTGVAQADDAFHRQAIITQIAGDLGEPPEIEKARDHLDRKLVPGQLAMKYVPDLLAGYLALAPAGSLEPLEKRLKEEQARLAPLQRRSEQDLMAYDQIISYLRNELDRTRQSISAKAKYAALPPAEAMPQLLRLYLGVEGPSDPYLQVWAARRVRRWAMENSVEPVRAQLRPILEGFTEETLKTHPQLQPRYWRVRRAFRYFGGSLDDRIDALGSFAKLQTLDFLDDAD